MQRICYDQGLHSDFRSKRITSFPKHSFDVLGVLEEDKSKSDQMEKNPSGSL